MRTLLRAVLWRRLDVPGLEHFRLWDTPAGPELEGTAIVLLEDVPAEVRYSVACTPGWETRTARIELRSESRHATVELTVDGGEWRLNGRRLEDVAGCRDVDLAITPSTNILPIRRLGLSAGVASDVTAAWVRFPDLTVSPLPQRYIRHADGRYRYESRGGSFTAELDVDDLGLVVSYGGLWERV